MALWPLIVANGLPHAALQNFGASVESYVSKSWIHQTDPEPQQLISHKFHCYVMTLVKALIPIVIRDIPVSAPIWSISFVCPACRIAISLPFSCRETPDDQYPSPRGIDHRTITLCFSHLLLFLRDEMC